MKLELEVIDEKITALAIIADHEEDRQQIRRVANVLFDKYADKVTRNGAHLVVPAKGTSLHNFIAGDELSDDEPLPLTLADGEPTAPRTAAEVSADHEAKRNAQ